MPPIVMRTYRPDDYPGNGVVLPFTVAPTNVLYSDWVDFGAPSLVSVTENVQGLDDPISGTQSIAFFVYELFGYRDAVEPAATPDGGATDGATQITPENPGVVIVSATEYEFRYRPLIATRWVYLQLSAAAPNTDTATVTVTLVI